VTLYFSLNQVSKFFKIDCQTFKASRFLRFLRKVISFPKLCSTSHNSLFPFLSSSTIPTDVSSTNFLSLLLVNILFYFPNSAWLFTFHFLLSPQIQACKPKNSNKNFPSLLLVNILFYFPNSAWLFTFHFLLSSLHRSKHANQKTPSTKNSNKNFPSSAMLGTF